MVEAILATVAVAALALAASGFLAQRIGLPAVFGYLVVGVALSPFVVGRELFAEATLSGLAHVGVLFLLFMIGLELDLGRLRKTLASAAVVLPFDILLPMVGAAAVARSFGWSFAEALALGAAVALSSTLLGERLTLGRHGEEGVRPRVLGVLIAEDVAAAGLLTFLAILGSGTGASAEGGFAIVLEVGRFLFLLVLLTAAALLVVPRLLDEVARRHVHELMVLWAGAVVLLFGYLGGLAGSAELGAFVAGVAAAEAGAQYVVRNALQGVRDAAVAVFFFASGVATDIGPVLAHPGPALAVAGVFLASKTVVHVPGAAAAGLGLAPSMRVAFSLGTVGEFSLILAAVAARSGIAHPDLSATIVGAALILLPVAAILLPQATRLSRVAQRLPSGVQDPVVWLVRGLRRTRRATETDPGKRRAALRTLASNLLLLAALGAAGAWAARAATRAFPELEALLVQAVVWGLTLAVGIPLWRGAFKGYRDLVWMLVGLRPGERVGAGRVRTVLVDTMVAASAVLVLTLVTLRLPATLPVLLAAIGVAAVVAVVAWRRLNAFHSRLEDTVSRILGRDEQAGLLLDRLLQEYPWGVRSAAVAVPSDSPVARRTVEGSRLLELTGAIVAVLHRRGKEIVNPPPDTVILPGDTLVLMGDAHQLARAEALVVAHGEAVLMTAQSRQATIVEVPLSEGSRWVGQTLRDADVRAATGALVAGIWPRGAAHPVPYDSGRALQAGDRLLVLGTELQVSRARAAARPEVAPAQGADAPPPGGQQGGDDADGGKGTGGQDGA